MKNKKFLALLDVSLIEIISQKSQYELMQYQLNKKNLLLANYINEDPNDIASCKEILRKINEKLNIQGIVFFSLLQLCYGSKIKLNIIKESLKKKYEVFFVRENIHIKNFNNFKKIEKDLLLFKANNSVLLDKIKYIQK